MIMGKPCVYEDIKTQQLDARVSSSDSEEEQQRLRPISEESEFKDTELEELVVMEGPQQILQLTLQEQVDHFMREETADADNYADWIKWVVDAEQRKQAVFGGVTNAEVPMLLQVQQLNDAAPCSNFKD
ncbi:unnamed protein product [Sphagnum troendelagicum]|uniref:Uncharacterized protein n=1 Tax=Sphagnum troendelagicum TaxID=128251 RepID=A0ABP0V1H5_9BRYO